MSTPHLEPAAVSSATAAGCTASAGRAAPAGGPVPASSPAPASRSATAAGPSAPTSGSAPATGPAPASGSAPASRATERVRHLVTVWNPSYAADALDEHVRMLLEWAGKYRKGAAAWDDVYVWWAKLRSPNRTEPLPHLGEVLALSEQLERDVETHLYLTDYRSLYVAAVDEITTDPITEDTPGELAHVPEYLRGHVAEIWFLLTDIRRLVTDDTLGVIEELKKLRNVRYHDRPVSLYGGMVDLPLIVWREQSVSWFAESPLLEGRLWAERDAELRGEVERLAHELRDNLFGLEIWTQLESSTKSFVASGEAIYRLRSGDPTFDLSPAVVEYAKALEVELNALVFPSAARALGRLAPAERTSHVDGRPLDLGRLVPHQTLGALATLLEHDEVLRRGLRTSLPADWKWLCGELPAHLARVQEIRNSGAHSRVQMRAVVRPVRDNVLGIGCEGLLVRLARARLRAI